LNSEVKDLDANIYREAENPKIEGFIPALGEQNAQSALYILSQKKVKVNTVDIGANRAE
jgi:hypothetical protein